jgi:hypothetical protein
MRVQATSATLSAFDHAIDQQEAVFNAQLSALSTRLTIVHESLLTRLNAIEAVRTAAPL